MGAILKPYCCFLFFFGGGLGVLLGLFWASSGPLGSLWGYWGPLGALLGRLGALLGGPSRGSLGALLGPSWEPWGPSWGNLGGHRSKEGGSPICVPPLGPSKSPLGALLGRSWAALGRSWGRLGGLLGPSWSSLGPSWGHLEASKAHRKRKGEKAQIIGFLSVIEGFCYLGGGGSWRAPRALGTVLERSLGPLGAYWKPY